jgi:hypothetical protein
VLIEQRQRPLRGTLRGVIDPDDWVQRAKTPFPTILEAGGEWETTENALFADSATFVEL